MSFCKTCGHLLDLPMSCPHCGRRPLQPPVGFGELLREMQARLPDPIHPQLKVCRMSVRIIQYIRSNLRDGRLTTEDDVEFARLLDLWELLANEGHE